MYETVIDPSMPDDGAAVAGTAATAASRAAKVIRRLRTGQSSPPATSPPASRAQSTSASVLQQSRDQRVDDLVAGFAAGRYDGLRLVEEVAQHIGRDVHGVATAA